MTGSSRMLSFAVWFGFATVALLPAQTPAPAKGPDKEIAAKIAVVREVLADRKFSRDAEGTKVIDELNTKYKDMDPKDQQATVKLLGDVLSTGKQRPPEQIELYIAAAAALGYCGSDGAKVLKTAYANKTRYPEKPEWVRLREQFLKWLGRTKDESMVKFLLGEALNNPEATLQAAAGEALGHYSESKEALRKEIVSELLRRYGSLDEQASVLGTNVEAQNARDRLATVTDKWHGALGKLTGQSFTKFRDWQSWYNDNKNRPW